MAVLWGSCLSWWRYQMETFSALLALCKGNSPVTGEFPTRKPVTRSFDVSFDLRVEHGWLNNRGAGDLRLYRAHYDVTIMWRNLNNGECHFAEMNGKFLPVPYIFQVIWIPLEYLYWLQNFERVTVICMNIGYKLSSFSNAHQSSMANSMVFWNYKQK